MKILYSCVILIDNKLYFAIIFKKYKNLKWYLILSGTIEHLTRKEERKGRDISYHKEEERERERERESFQRAANVLFSRGLNWSNQNAHL